MAVAFVVLLAIGALLVPDLRANPITWLISGAIILGGIGIVYRNWVALRADQSMIEMNKRR